MPIKHFDGGLPYKTDKPVYIGIDQSYSGFGLTALAKDGEEYYTVVFKADDRGVRRLVNIEMFLISQYANFSNVVDVAIEGYAFGSQMANMLGELGGLVKTTTHSYVKGDGQYPLIVPPTNLKKYITGKGNGVSKSQILLQVYKKWGVEFPDDNAADSYGLAHLVSGRYSLAYEEDVYNKLQDPKFREA
jgi:hypothetical protein